jgi:hypothetical protein
MAWKLNNVTTYNNPSLKRVWGTYTPQRRKLVVSCRVVPVRPMPHTSQTVFEKIVVGPAARPVRTETPSKPFVTPTLHQRDEVA